jgi:hypothetical protein
MLRLVVKRKWFSEDTTMGELYVNGDFECFTLEDRTRPDGEKVPKQTSIPYGTYKVVVDFSPKFQRNMPHVLDVPMFEGIRIHSGNTDEDTEGCILVGKVKGPDKRSVIFSRLAYQDLLDRLTEHPGEEIELVISSEPPGRIFL